MTRGCCGQVIYCIPSFDLVVVTTACGTVMDDPIVFYQIAYIDRFWSTISFQQSMIFGIGEYSQI
jgi:hypothetical protein